MKTENIDPVLVFNSLNFVQSITRNYGAEQGMAMWDTIANTVDRRLKLEVFKAMMNGSQAEGRVRIIGAYPSSDKIQLIRTLRQFTGMGLKEAKDSIEDLRNGKVMEIQVPYHDHPKALVEFRTVGFML
jgi:ribosomal protein L7/L12